MALRYLHHQDSSIPSVRPMTLLEVQSEQLALRMQEEVNAQDGQTIGSNIPGSGPSATGPSTRDKVCVACICLALGLLVFIPGQPSHTFLSTTSTGLAGY